MRPTPFNVFESIRSSSARAGILSCLLVLAFTPLEPMSAQTGRAATLQPDPPSHCDDCAEWNAPRAPFQVFGNTYYVGPAGVSALLIVGDQGHILLDGGVPQSATVIDANIRASGFRTTDVKVILTSHGHYDHVGGVHALQRYTGATVVGSAATVLALAAGRPTPDDPQYPGPGPSVHDFAAVDNTRAAADGEVIRVGALAVTVHYTPGHTPGATTYSWRSCVGDRCLDLVYADSLSSISNDSFRYTGDGTHPSIVDRFRQSIATVSALPCDIMISTHPSASGLDDKLARRTAGRIAPGAPGDPLVDPGGCKAYAATAKAALDARVKSEAR
ncbi:MAG: subclass B3 metallo-beta-lactamase [Vicinamibacterales bacterium]